MKNIEIKKGTVLYANTGVAVKVLEYSSKFGGRVLVERADGIEGGKPMWRPLDKFSETNPYPQKNKGGKVGQKKFSENYNVGKSKYVINYHDGVKTHKDGSEFYDIEIFKNKKDLEAFKSKLLKEGYVSKYEKGGEVNDSDIKELSNGYKEAILFTGYDEDEVELDANYSISDFDSKANEAIEKMAKQYIIDNKEAIEESGLDYGTIGRDIWYTQAGHGVGFFDEELDKDVEDKLTKGAKKFGDLSHNVFAQDGKVYLEGMKFAKGGKLVKFKKGDKVLTRDGKVETVIRKNSNGNIETEENDYSHNPSTLKLFTPKLEKNEANLVIIYDNGGKSFDRYTVFTPDGSVYGMSENGIGFNQYIGDSTEIEKGSHLGKKLKSIPKEIKQSISDRMKEFSKGGSMPKSFEYSIGGL